MAEAIRHDRDGFLVGEPISIDQTEFAQAMEIWRAIGEDTASIRSMLANGMAKPTAVPAGKPEQARNASNAPDYAARPAQPRDERGRFIAIPRAIDVPAKPVRQAVSPQSGQAAVSPGAPVAATGALPAAVVPLIAKPAEHVAVPNLMPAATPRQAETAPAQRDSRGRFQKGATSEGGEGGSKEKGEGAWFGRLSMSIRDGLRNFSGVAQGADEIDPAVAASKEVADTLAPVAKVTGTVLGGIGKSFRGGLRWLRGKNDGDDSKKQIGWLRRMWMELRDANKKERSGGGLMSMLSGFLGPMLAGIVRLVGLVVGLPALLLSGMGKLFKLIPGGIPGLRKTPGIDGVAGGKSAPGGPPKKGWWERTKDAARSGASRVGDFAKGTAGKAAEALEGARGGRLAKFGKVGAVLAGGGALAAAALSSGAGFLGKAKDAAGAGLQGAGNLAKSAGGAIGRAGTGVKNWFKGGWGPLGVGLAGLQAYGVESDSKLTREQKNDKHVSNTGGNLGAWGGGVLGAKIGASIGTVIAPGVGTAIGGAVGMLGGSLAGMFGGSKLGDWVNDLRKRDLVGELSAEWSRAVTTMTATWDGVMKTGAEAFASVGKWLGEKRDAVAGFANTNVVQPVKRAAGVVTGAASRGWEAATIAGGSLIGRVAKGYRHKADFSGVAGGDMLQRYGTYTNDEAERIRALKTGGANTGANLKMGMPVGVRDKIIAQAKAEGLNPETMLKIAAMESGGNANAISSTGAIGVYQMTGQTASGLGVTNRFDADQNIAGAMKLTKQNGAMLAKAGLPATPENLYMLHQLGPTAIEVIQGAQAGKDVSQLSPRAQKAMSLNHGANAKTAAEYVAKNKAALNSRYASVVPGVAATAPVIASAPAVAAAPVSAMTMPVPTKTAAPITPRIEASSIPTMARTAPPALPPVPPTVVSSSKEQRVVAVLQKDVGKTTSDSNIALVASGGMAAYRSN